MINEIRTLLLNKVPAYSQGAGTKDIPYTLNEKFGDEFIDPTFTTFNEHPDAKNAKTLLFGVSPDEMTYNYRLAQFMKLLRSEPVASQYLSDFDKRETYLNHTNWFDHEFGNQWTALETSSSPLNVYGTFEGFDSLGHNLLAYKIKLYISGDEAVMTIQSFRHNKYTKTFQREFNSSDRALFRLPDTDKVTIVFTRLDPATGHWNEIHDPENHWLTHWIEGEGELETDEWFVEVTARPSRTLADIDASLVSRGVKNWSFGLPDEEPFRTFKNMVAYGSTVQRRVAGVLLLVAHSNKRAYAASQ